MRGSPFPYSPIPSPPLTCIVRFYGKTQPFSDLSTAHLQFLNSQQARACSLTALHVLLLLKHETCFTSLFPHVEPFLLPRPQIAFGPHVLLMTHVAWCFFLVHRHLLMLPTFWSSTAPSCLPLSLAAPIPVLSLHSSAQSLPHKLTERSRV